jgi:membrane-associated protease RseP (regulator of RpoE activity)
MKKTNNQTDGKKTDSTNLRGKNTRAVVPIVMLVWAFGLCGSSLNVRAQDPAQDPIAKQAPEVPVVVEPAEELPVPEEQPKAAPARSKPPIIITPRSPGLQSKPTTKPPAEVLNDSLIGDGEVAQSVPGGGYLGLVVEPVQGGGFGLSVVDVTNQSPAWKAGFRVGDRIVGVGGQAVTTLDQFGEQLERYATGSPVKFLVQRRGRSTNLTAVLQDRTLAGQLQGINPVNPSRASQSGGVMLGVSVSDLSETFRKQFGIPLYRGAAVSNVAPGSTAEIAGLQPGDCISEINGNMILRAEDVVAAVQQVPIGEPLTIGYYRGKQKQLVEVPLLSEGMISGQSKPQERTSLGSEPITPQYVESLRGEIQRLQNQIERMQARLDQLEGTRP